MESLMLPAMAALLLLLLLVGAVLGGSRFRYPYRAQHGLFTRAEWAFFKTLQEAVGEQYLIMAKVRIADVLSVQGIKLSSSRWWKAFTKISSKHVDYVLCDRRSGAILCAIELDDRSHSRRDRRQRDRFVNRAFEQARLPLLRFHPRRHHPVDLRRTITTALANRHRQDGARA